MTEIKNLKLKIKNSERGYTMIELLAVIIIMVTVGVIIAAVLVSSLRGSNKTNAVNDVRKNGNYAVSQTSRLIEFAQIFDGVSTDGVSYTANCVPPALTPTPTPTQFTYLKITSFDNRQTVFSCSGSPLTIASNGASLVDTNIVTVTSCYFMCAQTYITEPPIVNIFFNLTQKNTSGLVENKATIPFETSVSMKNLK